MVRSCTTHAFGIMTSSRKQRPWISVVLGLLFGASLIILVLNGGQCERYERKMERQRMMREHLESMRSQKK
jgi:cytochrome oxidase assembly protein ShyY1